MPSLPHLKEFTSALSLWIESYREHHNKQCLYNPRSLFNNKQGITNNTQGIIASLLHLVVVCFVKKLAHVQLGGMLVAHLTCLVRPFRELDSVYQDAPVYLSIHRLRAALLREDIIHT